LDPRFGVFGAVVRELVRTRPTHTGRVLSGFEIDRRDHPALPASARLNEVTNA